MRVKAAPATHPIHESPALLRSQYGVLDQSQTHQEDCRFRACLASGKADPNPLVRSGMTQEDLGAIPAFVAF